MNKKKNIKIHFTDFWPNFQLESSIVHAILTKKYQLIIDGQSPDYLVFSCFGNEHLKYRNCIKIFYSGENISPDFNLCDYAIGYDRLQFGDRYFRLPVWACYNKILYHKSLPDDATLLNRKFCNFVYSNNWCADPFRVRFFKRLSEYKQVDSGGKIENNMGGCVADKLDFIAGYKFTLAFENSQVDGYTTEKLTDPMRVNSLPVYWGNPNVHLDFNQDSFIHVKDYSAMDEAIAEIMTLDNNDNAYLEKLRKPWFLNEDLKDGEEKIADFLDQVLIQNKKKAIRRTKYGFNSLYANARMVLC